MVAILQPVMVPVLSSGMPISKCFIRIIVLLSTSMYMLLKIVFSPSSFGLVKSYEMPCTVESASLEPKYGNKFVAGGEDMWVRMFDFHTGEEIGLCFEVLLEKFAFFVVCL